MNIIVYTKKGCPWCDDVRSFLQEKGIVFEEREVLSNKKYFDELVSKSGQTLTPTLDIDSEILADSDVEAVRVYLQNKNVL